MTRVFEIKVTWPPPGYLRRSLAKKGQLMASIAERLKAAATAVGVVWNVSTANDNEAIRYITDVLKYDDRQRIEEQLRRQGDADIAAQIR